MPSFRDILGHRGGLALLALTAYLLALATLLVGPSVLVVVTALAALAALAAFYLRDPEAAHRRINALWQRLRGRVAEAQRARARRSQAAHRTDAQTDAPPEPQTDAQTGETPELPAGGAPRRLPAEEGPGLATGSAPLRLLLGRGWREPGAMVRDFALIGLAGIALMLAGTALPDWPVLAWIAKLLKFLGLFSLLVASGVIYSAWQGRK